MQIALYLLGTVGIFLCIRKVRKGHRRVIERSVFDEDGVFQHIHLHPPMVCVYSMFSDIMWCVCVLGLVIFRQHIIALIAMVAGRARGGRGEMAPRPHARARDGQARVRARDVQARGQRGEVVVPRRYNLRPR